MHLALSLLSLVVVVSVVAGLTRRLGGSPPLVLVVVGVIGAYLPGVPEVRLDPELVLVGLLPPLLYAAAIRTSLIDVRADRRAIGFLSVGLVIFGTLVVGLVAYWVVPGQFSLAAGLALGAIVAPPDAVAATAIARRVGMPRRLVSLLEGESLLNDATALVSFNSAVLAMGASVVAWQVGRDFALAAVGGLVTGLVVAWLLARVRRLVDDPVLDTVISLVAPFVAYLAAERVHGSGVVAVVVTGVVLAHRSHLLQSGAARLSEGSNWRTVQFLLENTVFLLIGLQLPFVLDQARAQVSDGRLALVCATVLLTVLVARPVYIFTLVAGFRLASRWVDVDAWTWPYATVVSWAGMRGVVSLAAAFALPESTPQRGVLLLAAFVVVVGTLLLQGSTLPLLVRAMKLPGPDPAEDALQQAALLSEVASAGQIRLERERAQNDPQDVIDTLLERSRMRADIAWERLGRAHSLYEPPTAAYLRLRLAMLAAEREAVVRARDAGRYDNEVLRAVQAVLDIEESLLDRREIEGERLSQRLTSQRSAGECEHLQDAPSVARPLTPQGCEECLAEGNDWVHLRLCLTCGHVGCCDSSPRRHADTHFRDTQHPVMRSFEPHEAWRWCYPHSLLG